MPIGRGESEGGGGRDKWKEGGRQSEKGKMESVGMYGSEKGREKVGGRGGKRKKKGREQLGEGEREIVEKRKRRTRGRKGKRRE